MIFGKGTVTLIRGQGMDILARRKSISTFRDDPSVRFLVSTEAGGEGINLQFCHILVNYDIPWNPMVLEQRVGRVYRYLQKNRVLVYNLRYGDTIEDTVQSYLEEKMERAAKVLAQVTGEDVDEIISGLLGQLEDTFPVSYDELYKNALKSGRVNWTKKQIDEGIEQAEKAWKLVHDSLFKYDLSKFNQSHYESEVRYGF